VEPAKHGAGELGQHQDTEAKRQETALHVSHQKDSESLFPQHGVMLRNGVERL
jgi:hypothetical protein